MKPLLLLLPIICTVSVQVEVSDESRAKDSTEGCCWSLVVVREFGGEHTAASTADNGAL